MKNQDPKSDIPTLPRGTTYVRSYCGTEKERSARARWVALPVEMIAPDAEVLARRELPRSVFLPPRRHRLLHRVPTHYDAVPSLRLGLDVPPGFVLVY